MKPFSRPQKMKMMTTLFPDPQSPFEMEHNQQELQTRVADGRLLAFENPAGGVSYASPDRAVEMVLEGSRQLTLGEVQEHHRRQMKNRWSITS